jgi:hypothetical protein
MYSDLHEQEMLMERRMEVMDDIKRAKIQIDLDDIKKEMKKLYNLIVLMNI